MTRSNVCCLVQHSSYLAMVKFSLFPRGESAMHWNIHRFAKVSPLLPHTGMYSSVQMHSGSSSSSWVGEGLSPFPMEAHSTDCIKNATEMMANKLINNLFIVSDLDCFFFDERVVSV